MRVSITEFLQVVNPKTLVDRARAAGSEWLLIDPLDDDPVRTEADGEKVFGQADRHGMSVAWNQTFGMWQIAVPKVDHIGEIAAGLIRAGGPAYPLTLTDESGAGHMFTGMTLRDHFAGIALGRLRYNAVTAHEATAQEAYRMADAMLAMRSK